MIKNLKTLKYKLLSAEKKITTAKAISASKGGTGGRSRHGGASMFLVIPNSEPTYKEGLTVMVLAALEDMFA